MTLGVALYSSSDIASVSGQKLLDSVILKQKVRIAKLEKRQVDATDKLWKKLGRNIGKRSQK
jgi:hypothetical protein